MRARLRVEDAIFDELDYFNKHVWRAVHIKDVKNDGENKIISVRWVGCNKNDTKNPDIRPEKSYNR